MDQKLTAMNRYLYHCTNMFVLVSAELAFVVLDHTLKIISSWYMLAAVLSLIFVVMAD